MDRYQLAVFSYLNSYLTRKEGSNTLQNFSGHSLSEQTMDVAVPMVMLQHYLNPCLHYLIGPAMVTLVMWHLDDAVEISRGRYCKQYDSTPRDA
jgi:hypothetical protein